MRFEVKTVVMRKEGILDPQARQIRLTLRDLGFDVDKVKYGRTVDLVIDAASKKEAIADLPKVAGRIGPFYNPQLEELTIESVKRIRSNSRL